MIIKGGNLFHIPCHTLSPQEGLANMSLTELKR